jgi:hypothetical protein
VRCPAPFGTDLHSANHLPALLHTNTVLLCAAMISLSPNPTALISIVYASSLAVPINSALSPFGVDPPPGELTQTKKRFQGQIIIIEEGMQLSRRPTHRLSQKSVTITARNSMRETYPTKGLLQSPEAACFQGLFGTGN